MEDERTLNELDLGALRVRTGHGELLLEVARLVVALQSDGHRAEQERILRRTERGLTKCYEAVAQMGEKQQFFERGVRRGTVGAVTAGPPSARHR